MYFIYATAKEDLQVRPTQNKSNINNIQKNRLLSLVKDLICNPYEFNWVDLVCWSFPCLKTSPLINSVLLWSLATNTSTSVVAMLNALSAHVHRYSKWKQVFGDSIRSGIPFHTCISLSQVCCIYVQEVDWKAWAKWIELPEKAHADLKQLFDVGVKQLKLTYFFNDHMVVTCKYLAMPVPQYLFIIHCFEKILKKPLRICFGSWSHIYYGTWSRNLQTAESAVQTAVRIFR